MSCMPEEYMSSGKYGNYEQQEQEGQYCLPNCDQCSPPPTRNQQDCYDCSESMAGRDCDIQYYSNNQPNDNYISCESEMQNASGDSWRPCPDSCQLPMCSPFKKRRYVQPPRRQSFRPSACYKKPTIPMSSETVYRRSFEGVDASTANCCRPQPFNPSGFLRTPSGAFAKETVTKMSYQPFCGVERTQPIMPRQSTLLGHGPMQGLTTQKHDFVPKFQYRRSQIVPRDNISKSCGCIEKSTIQKLSFMPPCSFSRTKSFKPVVHYKAPELPMEFETTQKLSYMPVCPQPKEDMPWARKASYLAPTIPFANDTVTKLSFQPPGCFLDDDCCDPCQQACESAYDMPRAAC